jgi:electron transport complex protein RnfA
MQALALVLFSGLALNLFLTFSLGLRELAARERRPSLYLYYPWILLFAVTLLLWVFIERIIAPLTGGALNHLLFYPLPVLGSQGAEILLFHAFPKLGKNPGVFKIGSGYNCLSLAALFLTDFLALTFADALLLSFAFSGSGLLAFLIIKEIQKRSFLEALPYRLRGKPILLISLGLLSLIFSAAAVFLLKALAGPF